MVYWNQRVCPSVRVETTSISFRVRALAGDIKSYLVTALVSPTRVFLIRKKHIFCLAIPLGLAKHKFSSFQV